MSWQPIETAPKDGTEVLLCEPLSGGYHFIVVGAFWRQLDWITGGGRQVDPTHWMPLPAPPEIEA